MVLIKNRIIRCLLGYALKKHLIQSVLKKLFSYRTISTITKMDDLAFSRFEARFEDYEQELLEYEAGDNILDDEDLEELGYQKLSDITPMTMTMLTNLNLDLKSYGNDTMRKIHFLLPAMEVPTLKSSRSIKKVTLITPSVPYVVCNSRYAGDVRGTVKSAPKGKWPNGIMTDISLPEKIVNFKLSRDNINITGAGNIEMGIDGSKAIAKHINKINDSLVLMNKRIQDSYRIASEILEDGLIPKLITGDDGVMGMAFNPDIVNKRPDDDQETEHIRTFLSLCLSDIRRFDMAKSKLIWVLSQPPLLDREVEIVGHTVSLVKFKINLGFNINLPKLFIAVLTKYPEFYVDYDDLKNDYIKMEIYDPDNKEGEKPRKHSFNIKQYGEVTYSSGRITNSDKVYNYFITVIHELRSTIEY